MLKRAVLLVAVLLLLQAPMAAFSADGGDDDYIKSSWPALLRTMVRMKSIDLRDPLLLDEFSIITQCDMYKDFYTDDFKWHKVVTAVADNADKNSEQYPVDYYYDTMLQLDRYDFENGIYKFVSKATINNVNAIVVYSVQGPACGKVDVKYLPRTFRIVFDSPIRVPGLPLSSSDAEHLLDYMNTHNNKDKVVYTRFKYRVVYIMPLIKSAQPSNVTQAQYSQNTHSENHEARFDVRLDAIDFYGDEDRKKFIYEYRPY